MVFNFKKIISEAFSVFSGNLSSQFRIIVKAHTEEKRTPSRCFNPNPDGGGVYDTWNFDQVLLHNALSNQKFWN